MIEALLFYMLAVVVAVGVPALLFELYMLKPPRVKPAVRWQRVIYLGFPGWLDYAPDGARLWGPAVLLARLHFNGWLVGYTGSYTAAVINIIRHGASDES